MREANETEVQQVLLASRGVIMLSDQGTSQTLLSAVEFVLSFLQLGGDVQRSDPA